MLEQINLTKTIGDEEYRSTMEELELRLGKLQRECRDKKIPVMIVFEGFGASGKGVQIGKLIQALDPRGFLVYPVKGESEEERRYPFLWRFWQKTPESGKIAIYDTSWYRKVLVDRFEGRVKESEVENYYCDIRSFEEQLASDGTVIVKLFLDIDRKEQKKRFDKLQKSKETAWRVTDEDRKRNKHYDEYVLLVEEMLQKTDTDYAPWMIVEAMNRKFATVKIYKTVIRRLEEALARAEKPKTYVPAANMEQTHESVLATMDLSKSCTKEEYKEKLRKLQKKIEKLHGELYRRKIPVIIGFEGWDAGGKGGAIKRLTEKMDPRGYAVNPTASPNDIEKAHHYLWRFWRTMPKDGHIAIYDRTWYGRVMVERIEGFCTKEEWQRAFKEINDMEAQFVRFGAVVLKFWMHIDKDEQKRRFEERQQNPEKQWKITEEDWRNREKWDDYEKAVGEMLIRTSTPDAPWVVVEGNNKYYARIKVLESVVEAIEKRLAEEDEKNEEQAEA